MIDRLRRWLPRPETLQRSRWLRWLGPALHRPQLWQLRRRGIAMGVGIGMFFGVLLPIAQMPLSAGFAVLLRANIPAAVASTLVTNPVTTPPLYYAAWRLGHALLHRGEVPPPPHATGADGAPRRSLAQAWVGIRRVGKPLALGLVIVASALGMVSYLAVQWVWRAKVVLARRGRLRQRAR